MTTFTTLSKIFPPKVSAIQRHTIAGLGENFIQQLSTCMIGLSIPTLISFGIDLCHIGFVAYPLLHSMVLPFAQKDRPYLLGEMLNSK